MYTKYLKLFFLLILGNLLCVYNVFSQSTPKLFDVKSLMPSSPEAAMLGRFGDIPVGNYTGTANISIPLYTIKDAGVEIPIVLSYHSSGIKVQDEATKVGLGWFLEPEASIVQIINGSDDNNNINGGDILPYDDAPGYALLKSRMTSSYSMFPSTGTVGKIPSTCCTASTGAWGGGCIGVPGDSPVTMSGLLRGDGQPDLYQYNFAGYSGKFYINPETGAIVLLDKKNQITFQKFGSLPTHNWLATTLDGNQFYFTVEENVSNNTIGNYSSRTMKLSKIILNNSKVINFSYYTGYYQSVAYSETYHEGYPYGLTPANELSINPSFITSYSNTKTLLNITTDEVTINFNLEDRVDMLNGNDNDGDNSNGVLSTKRIKSVDIISTVSNQKVKSYNFYYSYFPYSTVGASFFNNSLNPYTGQSTQLDPYGLRLRLDSLIEVGYDPTTGNSLTNPAYKFSYDPTVMPLKCSFARDFWGYYNGQNNNKLMPDLSYFYYSGNSSFQDFHSYLFPIINGANRFANKSTMTAGTLKSIVYPTGGYTMFDYASNAFTNYYYPDIDKINSTTHNVFLTDMNQSSDVVTNTFSLPNTQTIKFVNTISRGSNTALPFEAFLSATITLTKISNYGTPSVTATPLKVWQMINNNDERQNFINNNYQKIWNDEIAITYDPTAVYQVVVSLPDNISQSLSGNIALVSSHFVYYSNPSDFVSYGGGISLTGIRNYSADNNLLTKKVFNYVNADNTCSGKLMSPLKFYYNRILTFGQGHPSANCDEYYQLASILFIQSEGCIPFSDGAQGHSVGYSRVEEVNTDVTDNTKNNGKHVYYYHNNPDYTIPIENTPDDPDLMNGLLNREDILDISSNPIQSSTYSYTNFSASPVFTGAKIFSNYFGDDYWGTSSGQLFVQTGLQAYLPSDGKYSIYTYPINNAWYLPTSKVSLYYSGNNTLTTTENYQYNSLGQLINSSSTNSKQQQITSTFLYPIDDVAQNGSPISNVLVAQGLYSSLIEQKSLVNGNEVSKIHLDYGFTNQSGSMIVNTAINKSYNQQPLFTDIQFNNYDSKKHLLQFTSKGIVNTLLWGYNDLYPVAKISGSDYNTVSQYITQPQIDANISNDVAMRGILGSLRTNLTNAFVETYTYKPAVGITSKTDPSGRTNYYEYDGFNRLSLIRDQDQNILKKYDYQYQATTTATTVPTLFSSQAQSGTFTRNCGTGYTGSSVVYTVQAGAYTSTISVADANTKAQADVTANGQNYANTNGTCSPVPTSCSFTMGYGYSTPTNGITNNGSSVSFYLVFYPNTSSAAMTAGNMYLVAYINGSCRPSVTRTIATTVAGRNCTIYIYPSGYMYWQFAAGSAAVNVGTTIGTNTLTYNL